MLMSAYFKKILVPVDGSQHASLSCRHAAGLASGGGAEILLVHCYGDLPSLIGGAAREEIIAESEAAGKAILAPCMQACEEAGVSYRTIVHHGQPSRTIVHIAKDEQCDLIVMGSRGLSDFSGMVLGSVSHRVLEYSHIPVLIVK